jgi:hypothetical protein
VTAISLAAPTESVWDALVAFVSRAFRTAGRSRPALPAEAELLLSIARDILGAVDLRDVDRRLDQAVAALRTAQMKGESRAPPGDLTRQIDEIIALDPLPEDPPEDSVVREVFGVAVGRKMGRALGLLIGQMRLLVSAMRDGDAARRDASAAWARVDPWSLHEGRVVPLPVMRAVSANVRGLAALLALMSACVDDRRPEPWLANTLADRANDGLFDGVRLLASLPSNLSLSLDVERFDLVELQRQAEEADADVLAKLEKAVLAGTPQVLDEDE